MLHPRPFCHGKAKTVHLDRGTVGHAPFPRSAAHGDAVMFERQLQGVGARGGRESYVLEHPIREAPGDDA